MSTQYHRPPCEDRSNPKDQTRYAAECLCFPVNVSHEEIVEPRVAASESTQVGELEILSQTLFHSIVYENYRRDPQQWYNQEIGFLRFYDKLRKEVNDRARPTAQHMVKMRSQSGSMLGRRLETVRTLHTRRRPEMKPRLQLRRRKCHLITQHVERQALKELAIHEDTDVSCVPAYCPSTNNLGDDVNALQVSWKGNALNLAKDPHRHLLHKAEVKLAETLRLSCSAYLCNKARIFNARAQCQEYGQEIRKTNAQRACRIDVNKASKLWTAFEKVGWFDERSSA